MDRLRQMTWGLRLVAVAGLYTNLQLGMVSIATDGEFALEYKTGAFLLLLALMVELVSAAQAVGLASGGVDAPEGPPWAGLALATSLVLCLVGGVFTIVGVLVA